MSGVPGVILAFLTVGLLGSLVTGGAWPFLISLTASGIFSQVFAHGKK